MKSGLILIQAGFLLLGIGILSFPFEIYGYRCSEYKQNTYCTYTRPTIPAPGQTASDRAQCATNEK